MIEAPTLRSPVLLRHKEWHHQRLEHAPAPTRHEVEAQIGGISFKDVNAQVCFLDARRLPGLRRPGGGLWAGASQLEIVRRRNLAARNPNITGHARLGVERAIV